ncbi:hypothetical protein K432DRAFT_303900 [Lepidopterella palustris CBS 459.81]|uniref:DUF7580 domain-containing protein n=1 Tax=Lepidopterella palustris CBS 459.81 TaxID=1314670 RepID=A0A8E2JD16_9PEZI|nr:hypothetical protein K432DRAFT_303900 [Lepidopterella palustris CBS 459.81]
MSGIEIAGLIMGAFPLLMAALERYREGAELLSDWWRIQRAYKKCKQDINYHRILFEGNLEEFLLPLVADEDELKVLMANPAGEAWEDPELEKRLQDRLPKSYELYLDIIGDINELMDKLKKELGVDNAQFQSKVNESQTPAKTKPSRKDLLTVSNFEFQAKRIKFSLKKASREKLFGELQEYNDKLRKLLESSDRTSAARRAREPKQTTLIADRKLGEFWRYAKKLHDALAKAWRCGCSSHEANLRLQHRTSDEADFDVLFRTKTAADIWKWQETNIKMIQTDCSVNAVAITVTEVDDTNPPPAISQHRRMMGPRPSAFNMGKHSVSILNIPGK